MTRSTSSLAVEPADATPEAPLIIEAHQVSWFPAHARVRSLLFDSSGKNRVVLITAADNKNDDASILLALVD